MDNKGIITQIIGPVVDVKFNNELPKIYNALKINVGEGETVNVAVDTTGIGVDVVCIACQPHLPARQLIARQTTNKLNMPTSTRLCARLNSCGLLAAISERRGSSTEANSVGSPSYRRSVFRWTCSTSTMRSRISDRNPGGSMPSTTTAR